MTAQLLARGIASEAAWGTCVMRFALSFVLGLISVAALAQSPDGRWYGEGFQPELRRHSQWLAHYRSDGSFRIEFRTYAACQLQSIQIEEGTWSLLNDQIQIVTSAINGQKVDASSSYFRDVYRIERLTETELRTTHIRSGQQFLTRRVDPNFGFPSCVIGRNPVRDATVG